MTTEFVLEGGGRTPHMVQAVSGKGVFLVAEGGQEYDAPWCRVMLPHREWQAWETKLTGRGLGVTNTTTAGPWERVKVPAGEFTAARVEWDFVGGAAGPRKTTFWYAHGIGLVRMNDTMRLKSFTPGQD